MRYVVLTSLILVSGFALSACGLASNANLTLERLKEIPPALASTLIAKPGPEQFVEISSGGTIAKAVNGGSGVTAFISIQPIRGATAATGPTVRSVSVFQ